MKKEFIIILALGLVGAYGADAAQHRDGANIRLDDVCLMHESRDTPFPADGSTVTDRAVSFQWPLPVWARGNGAPLDGFETTVKRVDKSKLRYKLRYSTDANMASNIKEVSTIWPFHNPDKALDPGTYYWQYSYVGEDGSDTWSPIYKVTVGDNPNKFTPPGYTEFIGKLPAGHPRILVQADKWDFFIASTQGKPERTWYIEKAENVLTKPM